MLELKDISFYLSHELQVMTVSNSIGTIRGYDRSLIYLNDCIVSQTILSGLKPILTKLSDFTEADWMEVFKAGFGIVELELRVDHKCETITGRGNGISCVFYYVDLEFNCVFGTFNQHKAFQKIYELKGDVNNLIGKGLAIDKKTLEIK